MKEMIKKVREDKEGFTLAELLVVVAIIAVLVAIAIPVFTSSLDKANLATDEANIRSAYAIGQTAALSGEMPDSGTALTAATYYYTANGTLASTSGEGVSRTLCK